VRKRLRQLPEFLTMLVDLATNASCCRRLWANSKPQGANTGMSLNMLRAAGSLLDYVLVMSYDAGDKTTTGYDPAVGAGSLAAVVGLGLRWHEQGLLAAAAAALLPEVAEWLQQGADKLLQPARPAVGIACRY